MGLDESSPFGHQNHIERQSGTKSVKDLNGIVDSLKWRAQLKPLVLCYVSVMLSAVCVVLAHVCCLCCAMYYIFVMLCDYYASTCGFCCAMYYVCVMLYVSVTHT